MTTLITSVAVPALAFVGKFLISDREPGALRDLKRHKEMREGLPPDAQKHFDRMIAIESQSYAENRIKRVTRKLDGASLAALIFVGVLTAAATWFLIYLGSRFSPWIYVGAALAALFGGLLMLVGNQQIWKEPDGPEARPQTQSSSSQ